MGTLQGEIFARILRSLHNNDVSEREADAATIMSYGLRPLTLAQVSMETKVKKEEIEEMLQRLEENSLVVSYEKGGETFYKPTMAGNLLKRAIYSPKILGAQYYTITSY